MTGTGDFDKALADATARFRAGELPDAERGFRAAIAIAPERADAWSNLAASLAGQRRDADALDAYRRAITLAPNLATAWKNAGITLSRLDRLEEGLACLERAASLAPDDPVPEQLAAGIARDLGRTGPALDAARRAVATAIRVGAPEAVLRDAQAELLTMLLGANAWSEAWALYRNALAAYESAMPPGPLWSGQEIGDRRLLVTADQGFGDIINFARYLIPASTRAAVVVKAHPAIRRLLSSMKAEFEIADDGPVSYRAHCTTTMLAGVFDAQPDDVRVSTPYLHADPSEVAAWSARLAGRPGLHVGICWSGGGADQGHFYDARRSIALSEMADILGVPGVVFVSLQKGPGASQIADHPEIVEWTDELHDFAATAALIAALDLTISVDTSVSHLAGALDCPVWMINRICSDGRYPIGAGDTPHGTIWYPSMRIYSQTASRDWIAPVTRVAADLAARVQLPR